MVSANSVPNTVLIFSDADTNLFADHNGFRVNGEF